MKKESIICLCLMILMMSFGCSSPEKQFESAVSQNTAEAMLVFLQKYPDSQFSDSAKVMLLHLETQKALESADMAGLSALKDALNDSLFSSQAKSHIELVSAIQIEKPDLLKKYLKNETESSITDYGNFVCKGQLALLEGDFQDIPGDTSYLYNALYQRNLFEIADQFTDTKNMKILKNARLLAKKGDMARLFEELLRIQAIVDNPLIRHTMADLLYTASKNMRMPSSLSALRAFDRRKQAFAKKLGSEKLKLGSMNEQPDYGNVCSIISTLTIEARSRSMITKIPMNEYYRGNVSFNGVMSLMNEISPLAGQINSHVIAGAEMLLGEEYEKLDVKGRYAVLEWLGYLVDDAGYGVTFIAGEVHTKLRMTMITEKNDLLKEMGEQVYDDMIAAVE